MTGNTHRTEFCIDKLYTPDSASGRRGLVEFRALEMPPHARMAAAQMLLMRSALAAFWEHPYERQLMRWGTRVHDDFMLPHYAERDFTTRWRNWRLGFPLDPAWFAPHLRVSLPAYRSNPVKGVELELRSALEPWHVLGEEQSGFGTVRYVDSSIERVQARVSGWVDERFTPGLQRRRGAAEPDGSRRRVYRWRALQGVEPAEFPASDDRAPGAAGVRRVRPLERALPGRHDLSRRASRRPALRQRPVNANEAEARRRARFFPFGHTPGPMPEPIVMRSREHPRTLDLRRTG